MKDYNMKDYKKILEGVVNIISTTEKSDIGFADICTYIGENCPELKESKDEEIRKNLIELFHDTVSNDQIFSDYGLDKTEVLAWLEKQGEHQPADKVKPKFHKGDWVIHNKANFVFKVVSIGSNGYDVVNRENYKKTISFDNDVNYRLWSIRDAKDGDVFCYKDEILLYKHNIKNCTKQETTFGGFVYHCCYDGKRFIVDNLYSLTEQDKMDVHPATKEQCDLLFQKMKEEGYEWDAYKKELKIIDWSKHIKYEPNSPSINTFTKVNNNLFKEVYFGKPYKTRDGRKALYCYKFTDNSHALIVEGDEEFWYVRDDGLVDDFDDSFMDSSYYTDKDIVSEW